tara:strand:- start:423 stop:878 length:456 start_codon:yes stop_codon:yes gene_type:complete
MDKKALDQNLVREFVQVAHGDLDRVKKLLEREPALVHASWDWGDGDWESGLGAASHTGSKAIAAYLLEKGAYMDIFCAAMLGKVDILKAFLKDNGDLAQQKGAYGIPLIVHAVADGQDEVVEFLKSHAPSKNSGVALMNCELEGLIRTKNC